MGNTSSTDQNVHKGHRSRMKNKFDKKGMEVFSEHEILEMLLFYSINRMNTNVIAHRLIDRFGSFARVLDAPTKELMTVEGIGEESARFLSMIRNVANYYINSSKDTVKRFSDLKEIGNYLVDKYVGVIEEKIYLICLDDKGNILRECFVGEGSSNNVSVDLKKIAENVILSDCTTAVIAHNHPTGVCKPSADDIKTTNKVKRSLEELKVNFLAQFLIAEGKYCIVD